MASVVICDVCDKILRLNEDCYVVESYSKGPALKAGLHVDLCPDCYNMFEKYIKSFNNQIN